MPWTCGKSRGHRGLRAVAGLAVAGLAAWSATAASAARSDLQYHEVCANNGRSWLWAQMAIDADVGIGLMERWGIAPNHTFVAVVDSGFDENGVLPRMAHPTSVSVDRGHEKAGDPKIDENGHGTMVASLIAGADGVGVAPGVELRVYRITKGEEGSASGRDLDAAVEKACDFGHAKRPDEIKVINLSWGGVRDEAGFERKEVAEKKFFEKLAEKGCVLVKSAGNDAYRLSFDTDKLEDALLRSEATDSGFATASFSSTGEVRAPGALISVWSSTHAKAYRPKDNAKNCASKSGFGQFVNGTSFSSPVTAAVLANVAGTLHQLGGKRFADLDGPTKIALAHRILKASELTENMSAARAVTIAALWARNDSLSAAMTIEELRALVDQRADESCRNAVPAATSSKDAALVAFERGLRENMVSCGPAARNPENVLRLFHVYNRYRNVEQLLRWLPVIPKERMSPRHARDAGLNPRDGGLPFKYPTSKDETAFRQFYEGIMQQLRKRWISMVDTSFATDDQESLVRYGLYLSEALRFLPHYYDSQDVIIFREKAMIKALTTLLNSSDFIERMSRRNNRGSERDIERVRDIMAYSRRLDTQRLISRMIFDWGEAFIEQVESGNVKNSASLLAVMRVLDILLTTDEFKDLWQKLSAMEWRVFVLINQSTLIDVAEPAEENPDPMDLAFFSDQNNFFAGYLEGFFERHQREVDAYLAGDEGIDPTKLSGFFLQYYLQGFSQLSVDEQIEFNVATLEAIGANRGWVSSEKDEWSIRRATEDYEIAQFAILRLAKLMKDGAGDEGVKERLRTLIAAADNFDLLGAIASFDVGYWVVASESGYLAKEKGLDLVLDRDMVMTALFRYAAGLSVQTPRYLLDNYNELATHLDDVVKTLVDSKSEGENLTGGAAFAEMAEPLANRIERRQYDRAAVPAVTSRGKALDYLVGATFNAYLTASEGDLEELRFASFPHGPFHDKAKAIAALLSRDGEARKLVHRAYYKLQNDPKATSYSLEWTCRDLLGIER